MTDKLYIYIYNHMYISISIDRWIDGWRKGGVCGDMADLWAYL